MFPLEPACPFDSTCVFHIHTSYQSGILGLVGNRVSKAKMYNFLKFSMNTVILDSYYVSTVIMDNFKDSNCRIVNNHGRISCQTGVRVSIFSSCRYINRDTVHVQK